jgi:hypothetical protein
MLIREYGSAGAVYARFANDDTYCYQALSRTSIRK